MRFGWQDRVMINPPTFVMSTHTLTEKKIQHNATEKKTKMMKNNNKREKKENHRKSAAWNCQLRKITDLHENIERPLHHHTQAHAHKHNHSWARFFCHLRLHTMPASLSMPACCIIMFCHLSCQNCYVVQCVCCCLCHGRLVFATFAILATSLTRTSMHVMNFC